MCLYVCVYACAFCSPFPEVAESVQEELDTYRAQEDEVKRLKSIMVRHSKMPTDECPARRSWPLRTLRSWWPPRTRSLNPPMKSCPEHHILKFG